ncbi:MAG: hypothetical protein DRP79_10125 [Planctomycetota bacterium]|nr:MAG: hypothetical protein DRP79_10125 [Planctomycetota bacterium]
MSDEKTQHHDEGGERHKGVHVDIDLEKVKQGVRKVREGIFDAIATVVPKGVSEHAAATKKEFLLTLRAFIDDEIKRTDENLAKVEKAREKREKD